MGGNLANGGGGALADRVAARYHIVSRGQAGTKWGGKGVPVTTSGSGTSGLGKPLGD